MKHLDHVAIAVNDLDKAVAFYRDVLGMTLDSLEIVEEQQVKTAIFSKGNGRIELISPLAGTEDSGVGRFLSKRGEGLHHICLEVENLERALAQLKANGVPLIDQVPKRGTGGAQVAFIHPKGTHGVLIELRQGR